MRGGSRLWRCEVPNRPLSPARCPFTDGLLFCSLPQHYVSRIHLTRSHYTNLYLPHNNLSSIYSLITTVRMGSKYRMLRLLRRWIPFQYQILPGGSHRADPDSPQTDARLWVRACRGRAGTERGGRGGVPGVPGAERQRRGERL